jgi:prenyl protein peptidase
MDTEPAHGLGQGYAFALLVAYCFIYVLPLYAWNATRPSPTRSRDAPEAIRARIRAVTFSTTVCSVLTLLILQFLDASPLSPLHLMGYWPVDLFTSAKAVFLTALLFAGPLFENLVIDGEWREWTRLDPLKRVWADWPTWRNLVAVCPAPVLCYPGLRLLLTEPCSF